MNRDKPLSALRQNYEAGNLREDSVHNDPIEQFRQWFNVAHQAGLHEPNAMNLATVDADSGRVSSRMVLLKDLDERGFVFYTNYESRKARELEGTQNAALCFWWDVLERQVRIEGAVTRVSPQESDEYFASRPRGSRIGAIASQQSTVLSAYEVLESRYAQVSEQYPEGAEIPRPANWGGYRLSPCLIEFWQGRPSRLHDRLRYQLSARGQWEIERLSP